jgi:hypothetical protein
MLMEDLAKLGIHQLANSNHEAKNDKVDANWLSPDWLLILANSPPTWVRPTLLSPKAISISGNAHCPDIAS